MYFFFLVKFTAKLASCALSILPEWNHEISLNVDMQTLEFLR